ncbi:MAG: hypothetical protein JWL83_2321 [Actinomycetia bacterium]|jgi:hypothetical protein|nr:hypothetical protein [Actinomycetes bacterium]
MTALSFEVIGARAEPYAATPTITLQLRVTETTGTPVHALALRAQVRIEPQRRKYSKVEEARLYEMFGEPARWGDSLRPFLWAHVSTTVGAFSPATEFDLAIACTYDFEVAGTSYLHALEGGEIPLILLFSGTAFAVIDDRLSVEPVAWHEEATFRLPARVWREMMDTYFPNSGWLRLPVETIDKLVRFKAVRALPTFDQTIVQLLKEAGVEE